MSFGFGVGDFIAVIELTNKIRKEFVDAPRQFKAISDEVRSFSIILQDVDINLSERELNEKQKKDLKDIINTYRGVLGDLEKTLDKYRELELKQRGIGKRIKRTWKQLTWEPDDICELRSRITSNVILLNSFSDRFTRENIVKLVRHQDDQDSRSILDWLTLIDYTHQQNDFINRRQEGTGQWLLDSVDYQAWLKTCGQTLFCPGIPGAGKTILTSVVVDDLHKRFPGNNTIGIAYIYCDFRRQSEQKADGLFASLLRQLCQAQPRLADSVQALYTYHKDKQTRPSLDKILEVLQSVVAKYSRVFIVVDALDECQISDGCRQILLLNLFNLQVKYGINIFATSRPISSIEQEFERDTILEIRASEVDVRRYLGGHMFRLPGFVVRSPELQEEIKTKIVEAVDGMFLLAQLYLDSLIGKRAPKAVRTTLNNFVTGSRTYDHAYEDAMERINSQVKDQKELAKQALWWITCAKRPLTISELQHALAVEIGESQLDEDNLPEIEDVVSACAGLITTNNESNIIQLVHYTTQEYFERTQEYWFPDAEIRITEACVTYLSFNTFQSSYCQTDSDFEARLQSNKLYDYAAHYWGYHTGAASCLAVKEFIQKQAQVEASSQALMAIKQWPGHEDYSQDIPKQMTSLHLAVYFGVDEVVQDILSSNSPDPKDSYGRTPLSWAAERGQETVVEQLLEKEANVEAKDRYDRTPLSYAAESGHDVVVQQLLEKGADIEARDRNDRTPLWYAVRSGYDIVVQQLLEKGADVEAQDTNHSKTPLLHAADRGYEAVVQQLLEKGADIEAKCNYGRTPLSYAAERGHEAVVKQLLEMGADVKTKGTIHGETPLSYAAGSGHQAVVKQLLEKGADIQAKGSYDRTPLSYAAERGHEAVVQQLLEHDSLVEEKDTVFGRTALSYAAGRGHVAIVQQLLRKGADIEAKDKKYGWTPLLYAASSGQEAVVQQLLEKGADVEVKDTSDSKTPLLYAAGRGHEPVVSLLLETGADIEAKDQIDWTPLLYAAKGGHETIVQLLLEKGADIEARDQIGWTPLSYAAGSGHEAIVQLLLEEGAEIEAKNQNGWTPLAYAAGSGHGIVAQLLLEKGAEIDAESKDGWTPLLYSAAMGHETVAQLLLERGANIETKDLIHGRTPLSYAAGRGHETVVRLLLEKGADIKAKDTKNCWTPLTWATERGHEAVIQLLRKDVN